ncbi:hypothetical protein L596_016983 [Steinernema carpocapsae]|uniref:Uncharacterized protein n=1 Tax=Steinernema carpocapsae TaxID=34508 RepID=A0A4U5N123_STECR|nr:hypothetical protein L596_016983 [Steinernema carpocapsae]
MNIGKKKKKTASTTESALNHADAVLSLTWNENMKHVLASGGADGQVLLWDLDKAECVAKVSHVTGNAQGLEWHPTEASQILAGTMSGLVSLVDCRTMGANFAVRGRLDLTLRLTSSNGTSTTTCAYVACEDGKLRYIDIRAPGKAVYSVDAHDDGVQALSLNYMVKDMLVTCGGEELKVWKNDSTTATLAHTQTLDLGPLMMVACCPDIPNVIVAGGRANDLIKTLDISKFKGVVDTFN